MEGETGMMTTTLRVLLILASLGTFALMMHKIRRSKVQIESSIFWIVLALVLVVYSVFPPVADIQRARRKARRRRTQAR